jgi:hypothetical protein
MEKSKQDPATKRVVARLLLGMAYNRETFKDKVEEHVGGALLEFYKATLGQKNEQTEWVTHWMTEVRSLLDRNLVTVIKHSLRGFRDRQKAMNEVFANLKKKDASYRRSAEAVVKKDYKLTKVKVGIGDEDTATFWKQVDDAVKIGLA